MFVRAEPLTHDAFAPFGKVIEHRGDARRHVMETDFTPARDGLRHAIWVSRLHAPQTLPVTVSMLERHPFSHQAFVPLDGRPFLVAVCPDRPDGSPDIRGCRAFVASPTQGVIYRRNVWHAGLEVFGAPAEFVVFMALRDDAANDEFLTLPVPIEIRAGDLSEDMPDASKQSDLA